MKFFRRPGLLASSALIVLLVLSSTDLLPLDRFTAFMTRTLVTPLFRLRDPLLPPLAKENEQLRALVRTLAGEEALRSFKTGRMDADDIVQTWAKTRSFPAPIMATVLTRFDAGAQELFLLDRGSADGVTDGSAVIVGAGILAGRTLRVRTHTSFLRLLTARDHRFSVKKEGGDTPIGVVSDTGDGLFRIEFTPRDAIMEQNNTIVTSGLDDRIPGGLLVGSVRDATPIENNPWQSVAISPFLQPADMTSVGVLVFTESNE